MLTCVVIILYWTRFDPFLCPCCYLSLPKHHIWLSCLQLVSYCIYGCYTVYSVGNIKTHMDCYPDTRQIYLFRFRNSNNIYNGVLTYYSALKCVCRLLHVSWIFSVHFYVHASCLTVASIKMSDFVTINLCWILEYFICQLRLFNDVFKSNNFQHKR